MNTENKTAVWVITRGGLKIAETLTKEKNHFVFFVSKTVDNHTGDVVFDSLKSSVKENFSRFRGHLFIMATGIVIRITSRLIKDKTVDPAVVSMDEKAKHVISLLSGHLGGANRLAQKIARLTGAEPVLSTATDLNQVPAIDMIAQKIGLKIENPDMIKKINMAFLENEKIFFHDPFHLLSSVSDELSPFSSMRKQACQYSVIIDDQVHDDKTAFFLRPSSLSVGIGCNRGTGESEITALLTEVFHRMNLSVHAIKQIATIDIKKDEQGILAAARFLNVRVLFFESQVLDKVKTVKNRSKTVEKHTGAKSVCEAAAILSAGNGQLIVEKQKTKNVTLAVARIPEPFLLSE